MASTGKKGKKNKGKTLTVQQFLAEKTTSWNDEIDESEKLIDFPHKPVLPAAPRAARAVDIDESRIPKNPPFVAYLSNLSYEVEESDISDFFKELNVSNVRLPRDEPHGRLKGFGYVEFSDRLSFVNALQIYEASIKNRRIKIEIADSNDGGGRRGQRYNRERESNYDPEKTAGDWRSGPRSEVGMDDRRGPSSGSRRDYGGFKERDMNDKGRGYGDRERERETSSWRENTDRRFTNDRDNRSSYGNRRNFDERDSSFSSEPKTRPKLNLQPRTLPIEEIVVKEEIPLKKEEEDEEQQQQPEEPEKQPEKPAPPAASIFGQAKPVDTAARERQIEERLAKEKEAQGEKDIDRPKLKIESATDSEPRRLEPAPEPKENIWTRRSQRTDVENTTSNQENNDRKLSDSEETTTTATAATHPDNERDSIRDNDEDTSQKPDIRKYEENENDRSDGENRYNRYSKNENRYNDRNRENDRSFRREDRYRDDRDRKDKERRDYDRRDRPFTSDKRGGDGGRYREQESKDGDNRRYNSDRDVERRYNSDRDRDRERDRDGDSRRYQDREVRYKEDDHGNNRGPPRSGEKRSGPPAAGDRGTRQGRGTQDRDRGPQNRDRPREPRKPDEHLRMPKYKEVAAPNYVGTNKYSFLDEDGASE